MKIGTPVQLVSFNGATSAPKADVAPAENYWTLIGKAGQVVGITPPPGVSKTRVLVKFAMSLDELGLHNHNEIADTLWIDKKDLSVCRPSVKG